MSDDRFTENNGLSLDHNRKHRPLNDSYYYFQEPDHTAYPTNSQPHYESGELRANMGGIKAKISNPQERDHDQTQRPLNEAYYYPQSSQKPDQTAYSTNSKPHYKSEEPPINTGSLKTRKEEPIAQYRRPDDRFFLSKDDNINLQEHGHDQYPFPIQESDQAVYPTKSEPRHKLQEPRINMGGMKTSKKGPTAQYRRERERVLSNTPVESLIQRLITQEYEGKESRKLLRTAITQLEALQRRATTAEEARRTLETGQTVRGLKVAQSVMDAQEETSKAKQDLELYRFQLEQSQRELRQKQEMVKTVELERDNAEKSATKARALARQLNDERMVALAREEGRKLGYAEGMRQGRMLALTEEEETVPRRKHISDRAHQTPLGSGAAFIEEFDEDDGPAHQTPRGMGRSQQERRQRRESRERGRSSVPRGPATHTPQSQPANSVPTRPSTPAGDAVRHELDAAKERMEEMARREAEQRETIRNWELREAERAREVELEKMRQKEAELEREKEIREKEAARQREMESVLEREREKERELERERNEERRKREEREQELEREREKVHELERERERERDASSGSSISHQTSVRSGRRLPYLRMPQPPPHIIVEPPSEPAIAETPPLRIPPPRVKAPPPPIRVPQQFQPSPFQRVHRRQSSSPETTVRSGSTDMSNLDIITFPSGTTARVGDGGWGPTNLSDITEVPSVRSHSRASASDVPSPTWLTNPPPRPFTNVGGPDVNQWRHNTGNDPPDSATASPITPTGREHLSPSFQPRGRANERTPYGLQPRASSGSTVQITIEPPSRPPSSAGIRDPEAEAAGFLSPNSRPLVLVPEEPPERPVIPNLVDDDLHNFPPPGFVPYPTTRTNPSESGSSSSGGRQDRVGRPGSRLGSSIYAPVQPGGHPPSQGGRSHQAPAPRTRGSIYANVPPPQNQGTYTGASQTPRHTPHQIYAPSPSLSGPQSLPTDPSRIYGTTAPRQIYGPPTGNSPASHTPRQIYAPIPPALAGTQPPQPDPSRIYAASNRDSTVPRHQIYGPTPPTQPFASPRSGPVIPPPPSNIYAPASPSVSHTPLGGPVRSGPVVPPPPGSMTPRGRNVYLNPNATPASSFHNPSLPGPGRATPLARFSSMPTDPDEDEDDGVDQDEQTRWNTQVNQVYGGSPQPPVQPALPIPKRSRRRG